MNIFNVYSIYLYAVRKGAKQLIDENLIFDAILVNNTVDVDDVIQSMAVDSIIIECKHIFIANSKQFVDLWFSDSKLKII